MVQPFHKPLDRPEREETWYCYYVPNRKKQNSKPAPKVPISQVPDLTIETTKEDKDSQRNVNVGRVLETDTKYVKLAKIGGRKNLLCYRENERRNTGPKAYKVPEWYYHDDKNAKKEKELSEEEKHKKYKVTYGKPSYKTLVKPTTYERPDYMTHLEPEEGSVVFGTSSRIPDRPIFGYDSFSFWKRDELEKSDKLTPLVAENVELKTKRAVQAQSPVIMEIKAKKTVKLQGQSRQKEAPGYRNFENSGYIAEWHEKWYMQACGIDAAVTGVQRI